MHASVKTESDEALRWNAGSIKEKKLNSLPQKWVGVASLCPSSVELAVWKFASDFFPCVFRFVCECVWEFRGHQWNRWGLRVFFLR